MHRISIAILSIFLGAQAARAQETWPAKPLRWLAPYAPGGTAVIRARTMGVELAKALRVVKPGGTVVIVDHHRPSRWHPWRTLLKPLLRRLEPYALDLWRDDLTAWLPDYCKGAVLKQTYFGGLYQKVVLCP